MPLPATVLRFQAFPAPRPPQAPDLPPELALAEFMHTSGRDKHNELYNGECRGWPSS